MSGEVRVAQKVTLGEVQERFDPSSTVEGVVRELESNEFHMLRASGSDFTPKCGATSSEILLDNYSLL